MKRLLLAALALSLSGCASLDGKLQNRLVITPDCDRGFLASLYGPFGLTTELEPRDVRAVCEGVRNAP